MTWGGGVFSDGDDDVGGGVVVVDTLALMSLLVPCIPSKCGGMGERRLQPRLKYDEA